jgi:threonyl-tRNA synthetase
MSTVHVVVRDGSGEARAHDLDAGTTAGTALDGTAAIAARVNGELRDLSRALDDGDEVDPVAIGDDDGLAILRHSTAHVLAQAVQALHPQAKLGIGPPIRDGFYYDFDVESPFTPQDLEAIEKKMREIVKQGQTFVRRVADEAEARLELASEPYKLELIAQKSATSSDDGSDVEVGGEELTIYDKSCAGRTSAGARTCRARG